jgi:hypothetical protein
MVATMMPRAMMRLTGEPASHNNVRRVLIASTTSGYLV